MPNITLLDEYFFPFRIENKNLIAGIPPKLHGTEYRLINPQSIQPRFKGRVQLEPALNLNYFKPSAVIDWMEIGFETEDTFKAKAVKLRLQRCLNSCNSEVSVFVTGPEREIGYVGNHFVVKIQEPTPESLKIIIDGIRNEYVLYTVNVPSIEIRGIEVSVDFYPMWQEDRGEIESSLLRWQMIDVLRKHHFIDPVFSDVFEDTPRVYAGARFGETPKLIDSNGSLGAMNDKLVKEVRKLGLTTKELVALHEKNHRAPEIDGTFYVGKRDNEVSFRSMDKVGDKRNATNGTAIELEAKDRRARIEVTFQKNGINTYGSPKVIGLDNVEDLKGFKFQTLRKLAFDFYYPTISAKEEGEFLSADSRELKIFSKTGIYGLEEYYRAKYMLEEARYKRDDSQPKPKKVRSKGYRLGYDDLNQKVGRALRVLTKKWSLFDV
jgi:hypothetical protein